MFLQFRNSMLSLYSFNRLTMEFIEDELLAGAVGGGQGRRARRTRAPTRDGQAAPARAGRQTHRPTTRSSPSSTTRSSWPIWCASTGFSGHPLPLVQLPRHAAHAGRLDSARRSGPPGIAHGAEHGHLARHVPVLVRRHRSDQGLADPMHRLGMLLKSYGPDLDHAGRLVASFTAVQRRRTSPSTSWCLTTDLAAFAALAGPRHRGPRTSRLWPSTSWTSPSPASAPATSTRRSSSSRSGSWGWPRTTSAWTPMRSSSAPSGATTSCSTTTTPYTVLVEDNELKVEPRYYEQHWQGREAHLRRIQELVGLDDRRLLTCHGHQVVLGDESSRRSRTDFMEPRGWTYVDMLAEAPYEFTWYNMWLQKSPGHPDRGPGAARQDLPPRGPAPGVRAARHRPPTTSLAASWASS